MRLVVRINACQAGALTQYRRGQTVTESGEKIIILIMMPWRPPFIYQSTSTLASVTLSADPRCALHLASNLIDSPKKHLNFFLCSSTLLLFILPLYPSSCYSRSHNFTSSSTCSPFFPIDSLKIRFSALFGFLSSIIANSSTYLFTPSDTCAWMQKCRKCVCSCQHTAAASPNQPWLQGWHLTGWWVMFKNFNFSKLLLINRWWNEAVEVNTGLCFVLLRVAFTDYFIDLLVCVVTKWAICK